MLKRLLVSLTVLTQLLAVGSLVHAKDSVVGEKSLPGGKAAKPATTSSKSASTSPKSSNSSPAPATPVPPDSAPPATLNDPAVIGKSVGYDKGFYIQTPDEKWKLMITGYTQFLFNYERAGGENEFGFQVRRARLSFSGNLGSKKLNYKLQLDFAKFKTELLLDAWLGYKIVGDQLVVWAGQFDVPWIRQNIISSGSQQFPDRSLATVEFTNVIESDSDGDGVADKFSRNGRDVGVMVHGKSFGKKLEYQGALFNGSGTNTANLDHGFFYAARTVYNVKGDAGYEEGDYENTEHPAVFIGASGNYNTRDITNDKALQFGGETGLKYRGFSAVGEFFYRKKSPNDTTLAKQNDFGYYAQAGYFAVPKRLELALRASQVFMDGFFNDQAEFAVGVNGYLYKKNVKLQSDYSVLPFDTKEGTETSQRFRLQLQSKF